MSKRCVCCGKYQYRVDNTIDWNGHQIVNANLTYFEWISSCSLDVFEDVQTVLYSGDFCKICMLTNAQKLIQEAEKVCGEQFEVINSMLSI